MYGLNFETFFAALKTRRIFFDLDDRYLAGSFPKHIISSLHKSQPLCIQVGDNFYHSAVGVVVAIGSSQTLVAMLTVSSLILLLRPLNSGFGGILWLVV